MKLPASFRRTGTGSSIWSGNMGLVRHNIAVMLSGAAITVLSGAASVWAQDAEQENGVILETDGAQAQAVNTSGTTVLDQITVISRTGESAIEQMASVSHIDQEQLERRMAATPQDLLFGIPGVSMQADANRTASSVNIRGLQDFGRVAVIVDGSRQNFQKSGHGTQSMFWLDPELIKQVDVIRGPVANTYGSGAIGGVVMIETKDATDFLREGETWAGSVTGRYDTNGNGWTTSGTGAYRFSDAFDVLGNIVWRDFDNFKDGDGNEQDWTSFDVLSGQINATIRPTDLSELKLGWVGTNDKWEQNSGTATSPVPSDLETKQNTFTGRFNIRDEDESWLDLHINGAVNKASHDITYNAPIRRWNGTDWSNLPAGAQTNYDLTTTSFDIWNTSRFETGAVSHELTYGGDWVEDDVDTLSPVGGGDIYTPPGKRMVSGAYIQEKLTWDWLEVIGALRYDSYKLESDVGETDGDRLSPRITVGVSPFENTTLGGLQFYGTYAEGYRSPTLSETLISGMHPSGVIFPFLPNPNLKPETAHTIEFGINYARDGLFQPDDSLRLKASYFNNDIDDYISGQRISINDGNPLCPWFPPPYYPQIDECFQYQNFANAEIRGFELEGLYDAAWGFAGLSLSIIDGHTVTYEGVKEDLLTIPSSQVTGQLGFRFLDDKLIVGGEVQFNGAPKGNPIAKDYTLVNVFASYEATDSLKFNARIDNLFDTAYANPLNTTVTSDFYEPGISFKMAASMRFGG